VLQATPLASSQQRVEEFKENTARKIRDLRCPDHHQAPRLRFQGATLRDINIQMSGCCEKLISLANEKIAAR
jgi:hypothetical protein